MLGCTGRVGTPNGSDIWAWWRVLGLGVLQELGHPIVLTFGSGGVYWDWVYWGELGHPLVLTFGPGGVLGLVVLGELGHPIVLTFGPGGVYWD